MLSYGSNALQNGRRLWKLGSALIYDILTRVAHGHPLKRRIDPRHHLLLYEQVLVIIFLLILSNNGGLMQDSYGSNRLDARGRYWARSSWLPLLRLRMLQINCLGKGRVLHKRTHHIPTRAKHKRLRRLILQNCRRTNRTLVLLRQLCFDIQVST